MTRDEQEMELWRRVYERLHSGSGYAAAECGDIADFAVAEFRKRYPVEPAALKAAWYDEPPFPGEYHVDGLSRVCWVDEDVVWCPVWDLANERPLIRELPRNGRRVCPIIKPQEPTT